MSTPTITGISHIDLTVTDLDRSEAFYTNLLGATRLMEGRNDTHGFASRYLVHADSMLVIGLVQHDGAAKTYDEHQLGLDHLAFNVGSREDLDNFKTKLEADAIPHSDIHSDDMWDVLPLRDPDNIQLEFFFMKPAAAALLTT